MTATPKHCDSSRPGPGRPTGSKTLYPSTMVRGRLKAWAVDVLEPTARELGLSLDAYVMNLLYEEAARQRAILRPDIKSQSNTNSKRGRPTKSSHPQAGSYQWQMQEAVRVFNVPSDAQIIEYFRF